MRHPQGQQSLLGRRKRSSPPFALKSDYKSPARRPRTLTKTVAAIRNSTIARHHIPCDPAPESRIPIDLTASDDESDDDQRSGQQRGKGVMPLSKDGDGEPESVEEVEINGHRCRKSSWEGVRANGVEYLIGDAALIHLKGGIKAPGLITSIFELLSGRMTSYKIHIHWLRESNVGSKGELFLEERRCQDVDLRHLVTKLSFTLLPKISDDIKTRFYCRFVYDATRLVWRTPVFSRAGNCDACQQKRRANEQSTIFCSVNSVRFCSETYHINDHIFIDSKATGVPWVIGRILRLPLGNPPERLSESTLLRIQILGRYTDLPRPLAFVDSNRLYATNEEREIMASAIRGRCIVTRDEGSRHHLGDLAFFCDTRMVNGRLKPHDLAVCEPCLAAQNRRAGRESAYLRTGRLHAMDLYSGGGGTATGAAKYFTVKAAVDFDPVSCQTLRHNHSETDVYCSSVDRLHLRELRKLSKKSVQVHWDEEGRLVPMLPKRGHIALLTACPPCQGHSGANHHKSADDERNDELFTCLSELDRLQADLFLFENVPGIKNERTDGSFVDEEATKSFAHLALTVLLALGYQCRLAVLDCRSYGSPQHRVRCFIMAARRGVKLPEFPAATHANPRPRQTTFGLDECASQAFFLDEGTPGTGPLPAVTAEQAISDLPGFHFAEAFASTQKRDCTVPMMSSTRAHADAQSAIGHVRPTVYPCGPLNTFQRSKRAGREACTDQYAAYATTGVIKIIKTAFDPISTDLPGSHRRAEASKGFNTLLTDSRPGGKATGQIHWTQRRTFTVAEGKRAQGLPDPYVLCGNVAQQFRQLGNMVNVDIADAIYRQMVRDSILPWYRGKEATGEGNLMRRWRQDHPVPPFHPVFQE